MKSGTAGWLLIMSGKIKYCSGSFLCILCGRNFCGINHMFFLILSFYVGIFFLCIPVSKTWGGSVDSFFDKMKMDWGGHVKVRGSVSWPDDEALFGEVETDPCYDGGVEGRIKSKIFS